MNTRIIVDSCVDFNNEVFGNEEYMERIPFKLLLMIKKSLIRM